jgi:molybdate-binding protein/DNA-binding transcriptional regulator YhcF (GntR family)
LSNLEPPLFVEIAESIRQLIASGELEPDGKLPAVREMAQRWGCSPGTVHRAYALLAQEGLIVGHGGSGTRIVSSLLQPRPATWRWAALVSRADEFLLFAVSNGHTPAQAEAALSLAVARWQELQTPGEPEARQSPSRELRFVGSHDLAVELLPRLLEDHLRGTQQAGAFSLSVRYVGSLGGLMALARNEADLAGIHLWDTATGTYNTPFVQRVLPGRRVALVGLVSRQLGLIVPPGNPQQVQRLTDLAKLGARMVNRQAGSGTRVWLDAQLKALGIAPDAIAGYETSETSHLAVARTVARREATVGLGIQSAATAYALDFVPLTQERYDLVVPAETWDTAPMQALVEVIHSEAFRNVVLALGGYDLGITGQVSWIE